MNRISALKTQMQAQDIPALLVVDPNNIRYLTGFSGHAATLLVTHQSQCLITDYRYHVQAMAEVTDCEVICRDRIKHSLEQVIQGLLSRDDVAVLGFEADHVSFSQWRQWNRVFKLQGMVPTRRLVEGLRYVKDDAEIECIQQAASIADEALTRMLSAVKAGVSERDLATELEYHMRQLGSEEPAFPTILLFGERSALPHGVPSERCLQPGDLMLVDFGAVVQGYRSDMTRTHVFGHASTEQMAVHALVSAAQQAALDAVTPGVTGADLAQTAAAVIEDSDYAQYMGEGLGHGVGLDLHEFPFMGPGCDLRIEAGCVVTIEPGIYVPEWGGVRIEDDVVLQGGELRVLNQSPRELLVL